MPIHYRKDEHIVLITIDRPEKRNALDIEHATALFRHWKAFRDDPDAWVAIVTGVDDAFCAGGDLADVAAIAREEAEFGHSETHARMNNHGGFGRWRFVEISDPYEDAPELIRSLVDARIADESARYQSLVTMPQKREMTRWLDANRLRRG